MKKMKNVMYLLLALVMCAGLCAGCAAKKSKAVYTITVMNGETEVGTISATEGEVLDQSEVSKYENLENYSFAGWYGTPTFMKASALDLTTATFSEDTKIFGDYTSTLFTEDTRSFYIVGDSPKGGVLKASEWAGNLTDEQKAGYQLLRTEDGKNEFAITLDMYEGDEFQVIINWKWDDQHGFGYVANPDDTYINTSEGAGLSDSIAKKNISIKIDGNYTVTLATDPENGEHDVITIVRNGDATVALADAVKVTPTPLPTTLTGDDINIRVKGSWKSDWSEILKLENVEGTNDWTITMDLAADTELCFAGYNGDTDSGVIMKEGNVTDADSLALLTSTGNNIKVTTDGNYTFTVNVDDLSVKITKN